MTDERVRFTA